MSSLMSTKKSRATCTSSTDRRIGKQSSHSDATGSRSSFEVGNTIVYTDGSCLNNPGPGGWGFCIQQSETDPQSENDFSIKCGAGKKHTTNNEMELLAAIETLEYLHDHNKKIIIKTDSKSYVINGATKYAHNWIRNQDEEGPSGGRAPSGRKTRPNMRLWYIFMNLIEHYPHGVEFIWVKGHVGIVGNEIADGIANSHAKRMKEEIRRG